MRVIMWLLSPIVLILPSPAQAQADLTAGTWQTTYDCPEWTQADWTRLNCPAITVAGGWTCDNGHGTTQEEQITTAANNSIGGGGRGQRHWKGDTAVRTNNNSGGLRLWFTESHKELWLRWYIRWERGFRWDYLNYDKILYLYPESGGGTVIGLMWADQIGVAEYYQSGVSYSSPNGNGWPTIMGGATSDGQWHCFEAHLKTDSNGSNGIAEIWVDGVQRLARSDINNGYGAHPGWQNILIGSNQSAPANGRCMYVDYDDLAASIHGRIQCLANSDQVAPAAPTGLLIVPR